MKHIFFIFFFSAIHFVLFAQSEKTIPTFSGTEVVPLPQQQGVLTNYFKKQVLINFPIQSLYQHMKNNQKGTTFRFVVNAEMQWTLYLELHDMRSADYHTEVTTDKGSFPLPVSECINYAGSILESHSMNYVRLNISKEEINGVLAEANKPEICIEPLTKFIPNANPETFICYTRSDLLPRKNVCSGGKTLLEEADDRLKNLPNPIKGQKQKATLPSSNFSPVETDMQPSPPPPPVNFNFSDCYKLDIATEIDWEGIDGAFSYDNNDVLNNLNIVEPYFINPFNIRFQVRFQHVWNTSNDPYTSNSICVSGTDRLDQFKSYWNSNFSHIDRDISLMYTGVNVASTNDAVGCAFTGTINDANHKASAYAVIQVVDSWAPAFLSTAQFQRAIMAHEIGHVFGASHDLGCTGVGTGPIMCETVDASCTTLACTPYWSSTSLSSIESILSSNVTNINLQIRKMTNTLTLSLVPITLIFSGHTLELSNTVVVNSTDFNVHATQGITVKPGFVSTGLIGGSIDFKIASCTDGDY